MQRKHILGLSLAVAALASVAAYAQRSILLRDDAIRDVSADLPVTAKQRVLSQRASQLGVQTTAKRAPITAKLADPIYPVTEDEVYDVDSFGRNVRWLGLASAFINLQPSCPKPTSPDEYCEKIDSTPGAYTSFSFNDAARIKLPKYASNSLLCYWFSPVLTLTYHNPTASRVTGRFRYTPTLTIENPVLSDPSLIDPTTGAPFGGQLLTSMTSSERFETSLEPLVTLNERTRDSTVCMAGFISHKSLIQNYGLTPSQADDFFASPTTVRLNVSGSVQYVSSASLVFGLRVVGD